MKRTHKHTTLVPHWAHSTYRQREQSLKGDSGWRRSSGHKFVEVVSLISEVTIRFNRGGRQCTNLPYEPSQTSNSTPCSSIHACCIPLALPSPSRCQQLHFTIAWQAEVQEVLVQARAFFGSAHEVSHRWACGLWLNLQAPTGS